MPNKVFQHLIILMFVISPFSYAKKAITLTLVTENLPPFQMKTEGNVTGFATEVVMAALKYTPYKSHFKLYPWSRSYNLAKKKENTCVYSISRTPEREKMFQWAGIIAKTNAHFIGLKTNREIKINKLNDAKNYITAVIRDDYTHQLLLNNGFEEYKHFYVVDNPDSLLKLLISRKNIDLILVDFLTIPYRAKFSGIDASLFVSFLKLTSSPINFYLACSNNTSASIVDNIASSIDKIKATGEYQKIVDKWLGVNSSLTH